MQTDILVIGSGPAGSSVAHRCAEAGKRVIIVDSLFGGTCALRGCTPKKAMEVITSNFWAAKEMGKAGFPMTRQFVDWSMLVAQKSHFTSLVPAGTKAKFEAANIKTIVGIAKFEDEHTVSVGGEKIKADKIVIATGATPLKLDIDCSEYLVTNDEFFTLDEMPPKVVIVGGGYIAFELSHIIAASGTNVTILSGAEMPLEAFDSELVGDLVHATLAKGIEVKLGYMVNKVEKNKNGFEVFSERKDGQIFRFGADLVIHAAGRIPNVANLDIEQIGLTLNDKNGIEVNRFMETTDYDHIYALGDVTGQLPFTEIANYEAKIVAHNILGERRKSVKYDGVPYGVFTYPKLAKVGKSEADLKKEGTEYKVKTTSHSGSFIERTHMNSFARYKTLVDRESNRILGASILAVHADDMINLFSIGILQGMTAEEFGDLLLLYPTAGHDVKFMF